MIRFGRATCGDLAAALKREWLETNGLGGFASSTLVGLNTRRYHGLLVAATNPPAGRLVLLSKLEETLVVGARRFELASNQYSGGIHPQGHRYLVEFRLDPFPVFTYEIDGVRLEKSVFMIHGENSTVVFFQLEQTRGSSAADASPVNGFPGAAPSPVPLCQLELRPLIAFREYHAATHRNDALDPHVHAEPGLATVAPYAGLPVLHFAHDADQLDPTGHWYFNFEYAEERERGFDYVEDLFNPLILLFDLSRRSSAAVIASTTPRDIGLVAEYRQAEIDRRRAVVAASLSDDSLVHTLTAAADQYIVSRQDGKTVIAGYPWFVDWGRDTMVALPGLTLLTGRANVARSILLAFARYVDKGMLPNRFPDAGEAPEYNTVDATLWFFEAVRAMVEYTGDIEFVGARLYPILADIVDWHVRGTRYGIRVDDDGLLRSGQEGVQLTWMDAKVGDLVVTPRRGKPVEVQALWYNALRSMEDLARELAGEDASRRYREMADLARRSFNDVFWNEAGGYLYDVVDGEERDASVRPNQVLAVSLRHTMLPREKARRVLEVLERDLLTPYGLRSLAPSDPRYRGRYEGDPAARGGAYHQGTVWAWLMGPFVTAHVRVHGRTKQTRETAARCLEAFREHLADAGLGQISEIFDGDPPHRPRGCIAQAWSVAELLRATIEDLQDLYYL